MHLVLCMTVSLRTSNGPIGKTSNDLLCNFYDWWKIDGTSLLSTSWNKKDLHYEWITISQSVISLTGKSGILMSFHILLVMVDKHPIIKLTKITATNVMKQYFFLELPWAWIKGCRDILQKILWQGSIAVEAHSVMWLGVCLLHCNTLSWRSLLDKMVS